MNFYITGDTHSNFSRIVQFCRQFNTEPNDLMVILGDVGINTDDRDFDFQQKTMLADLPITLFCVHGNHENRPQNLPSYKEKMYRNGVVFVEDEFPNLLFPSDGEIFDFDDQKCIVIGGAYSIDKLWRISDSQAWWADEQPSPEIRRRVEDSLEDVNYKVDIVLTHTCPLKYIPREAFMNGVDQSTVDIATECWLDEIESKLDYSRWYCGHHHIDKEIDKVRFLFELFEQIGGISCEAAELRGGKLHDEHA